MFRRAGYRRVASWALERVRLPLLLLVPLVWDVPVAVGLEAEVLPVGVEVVHVGDERFDVEARLELRLVVDVAVDAPLLVGHVVEDGAGDLGHPEALRGHQRPVARHYLGSAVGVVPDADRVVEAVFLDARGDVLDLLVGVYLGVVLVRHQRVDGYHGDLEIGFAHEEGSFPCLERSLAAA